VTQGIHERLAAFLATPNHDPHGEWPTITADEHQEFITLMYDVARAKWGEDCDGDMPIKIRTYDRKREDDVIDMPMLRPKRNATLDETVTAELNNIRGATYAIEAYSAQIRYSQNRIAYAHAEEAKRKERMVKRNEQK
jgi:hypothetical protein